MDLVPRTPVYVPATVRFNGKTWWSVGLRYKGNATLAGGWRSGTGKLPFRLNFDKFEEEHPEIEGQHFYGFSKLSLSSNQGDASYIRDHVATDTFLAAGCRRRARPSPRCTWTMAMGPSTSGSTPYLMDDPVYRARYEQYARESITGPLAAAAMKERMQQAHDLIAPWVTGENAERQGFTYTSAQQFGTSLSGTAGLFNHADQREAAVRTAFGISP